MAVGPVTPHKIDSESEADAYLTDLLQEPENRSMLVVEDHAHALVEEGRIRAYFIEKGKRLLTGQPNGSTAGQG